MFGELAQPYLFTAYSFGFGYLRRPTHYASILWGDRRKLNPYSGHHKPMCFQLHHGHSCKAQITLFWWELVLTIITLPYLGKLLRYEQHSVAIEGKLPLFGGLVWSDFQPVHRQHLPEAVSSQYGHYALDLQQTAHATPNYGKPIK